MSTVAGGGPFGPPTSLTALNVAGVPTIGTGGLLPFTGNYFFVNESTGSDGNPGTAQAPFKTITQALANCIDSHNDVVFVTGTIHTTATIAWSKSWTHLVGLSAPNGVTPRSRISSSGSTAFTPLVNVTGSGCIFMNIGAFHGFNDASTQICWAEKGGRNYYQGCAFLGMGNTTAAAQTGSRNLTVGNSGNGENRFVSCVIGLDTVARNATNYSVEFLGGSPRNIFENCTFDEYLDSSGTAACQVKIGAAGIDRWVQFKGCNFVNCIKSAGTTGTASFLVDAAAGGFVLLQDSWAYGTTDLEASASGNIIGATGSVTNTTTSKAVATNW